MRSIFLATSQAALVRAESDDDAHVHLNNDQIFIDSPDFNDAVTYTGYFDLIRDFKDGVTLKNQTFYDSLDHQKFSTYGFGANYTPNVIENKTSLELRSLPGNGLKAQTTGGFSYRYSDVTAGEERTLYPGDRPARYFRRCATRTTGSPVYSAPTATGTSTICKTGTMATPECSAWADFTLFNKLTVLQGVRYDYYTPNFRGQDNGEGLTRAKDSGGATTFNTSVSYRLPFHISPTSLPQHRGSSIWGKAANSITRKFRITPGFSLRICMKAA